MGWCTKDNTWEPIEHLAGCEDMIAAFKEKEKTLFLLRATDSPMEGSQLLVLLT